MKNVHFISWKGTRVRVTGIPDEENKEEIKKILSLGKTCELEAIGIFSVDYHRLMTTSGIIQANIDDLITGIRRAYGVSAKTAASYIQQVTNEIPETVNDWIKGKYKMPRQHMKRVRDFIISGRKRQGEGS